MNAPAAVLPGMPVHPELPAEPPFTVMPTLHGPSSWHDVVDTKAGHTIAVCPKRCFAREIADALTERRAKRATQ